jgi:hypothetical protein
MALRGEIVDFIGLHFLHDVDQAAGIGQIAVVQYKMAAFDMRVLIQMVDAVGVNERSAALDAMHLVSLLQ